MRYLLLLTMVSLWACTRTKTVENEVNPPIPIEPEISLVAVNPLSVKALEDPIQFTLFYRDGDGDLGFYEADSLSLFITDDRLGITQGYFIQPLAPQGATIAIQGNLVVTMDNTIHTGGSGPQTVTFSIRLKDRAGHWSNTVTSEPVTVLP